MEINRLFIEDTNLFFDCNITISFTNLNITKMSNIYNMILCFYYQTKTL